MKLIATVLVASCVFAGCSRSEPSAAEEAAARPADEARRAAYIAADKRDQIAKQAEAAKPKTADDIPMPAANASVEEMRRVYLAKLSAGQKYTLSVGGDGTAVTVQAEICNDTVLGIFNTDLGAKLKKFGFAWLVCADQSARQRL